MCLSNSEVDASDKCGAQARLLEHNVRFGDPECQCLMMRLQSDLLEVLLAAAEGRLGAAQLQWSPEKALTVRHFSVNLAVFQAG